MLFALVFYVFGVGASHAGPVEPRMTTGNPQKFLAQHRGPRVAVLGSAVPEAKISRGLVRRLERLGQAVAARDGVLFTGACPGVPQITARATFLAGGTTVGVSPARSRDEHVNRFKNPTAHLSLIQLTGSGAGMGFIEREAPLIRNADILVYAHGRSGTLGELMAGMHERKVIAILERSGAVAGQARREILPFIGRGRAVVVFDSDPDKLLEKAERAWRRIQAQPPAPTLEHVASRGPLPAILHGKVDDRARSVFSFLGNGRLMTGADKRKVDTLVDLMAGGAAPALMLPSRNGLTAHVARRARALGVETIGVSTAHTRKEHLAQGLSVSGIDKLLLTGKGPGAGEFAAQRHVVEPAHVVFVAGGDYKTLGGTVFAMYHNTVVAVLETHGMSGKLRSHILKTFDKKPQATVIFDSDPVRLYERALNESAQIRTETRKEYLSAE